MSEHAILIWAAGAPQPIDHSAAVDEARLLTAIGEHRLAGRLLQRLEQAAAPLAWATETLVTALRTQQQRAEEGLRHQARVLCELQTTLATTADERPFIILKGFTTYALTGNRSSMRMSWDVDVLAKDPEQFRTQMLALGYQEVFQKMPHEFVNLSGDVAVDVHKWFPAWSYPTTIELETLAPERHPGRWDVQTWMNNHKIEYRDVLANAMPGVTPETSPLLFANPMMAVIVLCAHIFKGYVEVPAFKPRAKVRLSELAEVAELLHHEQFDAEAFTALVRRLHAQDAVEFVGALLSSYFGHNPLPADQPQRPVRALPRDLYWGVLMALDAPPDDLLIQQTPLRSLMRQIGCTTIVATTSGRPQTYTALAPEQGQELERIVVRRTAGQQLPLRFSAVWGPAALEFEVAVLAQPGPVLEELVFLLGETSLYCGYRVAEQEFVVGGIAGQASIAFDDAGYTIRATLPWHALPDGASSSASIPIVLVAHRFTEAGIDNWGPRFTETLVTTIVPIEVVPEASAG